MRQCEIMFNFVFNNRQGESSSHVLVARMPQFMYVVIKYEQAAPGHRRIRNAQIYTRYVYAVKKVQV